MTENDLSVARDIGSLQSDVRTIKHDIANVQQSQINFSQQMTAKMDALGVQIAALSNTQARGLGFFAGVAFIITACGGALFAFGKLLFGGHA